MNKRVLLIAGGGTLGTYTAEELLKLGVFVDVICLEEKVSSGNIRFYKAKADYNFLKKFLSCNYYDAIVNFIHYTDAEEYRRVYPLLIKSTSHLIFLSSYRVYAGNDKLLVESSPRLIDVIKDEQYLAEENYAIPKAKCENFLNLECKGDPFTIIRPVISFSASRLDLFMYSGSDILDYARSGRYLILPESAKFLTAGLDWAKNSGMLISNLLFRPETFGESYTVSSAQNLTWGKIADIYSAYTGLKVKWTDEKTFLKNEMFQYPQKRWAYFYDRIYDRKIDNSKILKSTNLKPTDFKSIEEGIKTEVKNAYNL